LATVLLADLRRLNRLLGRDSKPHVDYDVREIVYGGAWRDLKSMITETFDASVIEAILNIYSSLSFVGGIENSILSRTSKMPEILEHLSVDATVAECRKQLDKIIRELEVAAGAGERSKTSGCLSSSYRWLLGIIAGATVLSISVGAR